MEQTPRKRGRPRLPVTEELIETTRLSKQRRNRQQRGETHLTSTPISTTTSPPVIPVHRPGGCLLLIIGRLFFIPDSAMETPRQRTNIDIRLFTSNKDRTNPNNLCVAAASNTILDIGAQDQICRYYDAVVWASEFTGRHLTPPELAQLLTGSGRREVKFRGNSRMYNNVFALYSFGGSVDESINNGSGPYVFRVNNHVYHSIGSLLPPDGRTPKYAQFYMYDGQEAIEHRLHFPHTRDTLDPDVIPVRLRLLERRSSDGCYVNIPGENDYKFAGLVVDQDLHSHMDILVHYKQGGLEKITEIHPCFMSLQYPLLFPHGEDGYRLGIRHRGASNSSQNSGNTVSMREFQAFRLQFRASEGRTLLLGGRLFLQYVVDAWCCIERNRLKWVEKHQSIIRSDLYKNIVDSVNHGDTSAVDVGKRVVLSSSFTSGFRYTQQNFQDSLALCKEYGHPNLFVTFTCNPKWVEIQRSLAIAGGGDASVRPDLIARILKLKLDAMMSDFMKKDVVGRVLTGETLKFHLHLLMHSCLQQL
ncbi:hypothetical protein POM88_050619 [Heracleum sosnowskyi]|uniref:Helitron helicase-like domain-containing protein n=1 Tax=Heracleum sosnowskyi TaxID=360622 RepID=A0AAD8M2V9_9APIA|nr:hypothetical protein POM88_050619 [Heracleum sosnowskyi]